MKTENLGIVYHLSAEDTAKAIHHWLTVVCNQKIPDVSKIIPEFSEEPYWTSNSEQDYREVFDGLKVVCR